MAKIIVLERALRPALPTVIGNVDYTRLEEQLKRMDELLRESGVEKQMVGFCLETWRAELAKQGKEPTTKAESKIQVHAIRAQRTMVLKAMLGEDFRGLSRRLAECALFRWFCELDELVVKVPAKSTLQRYSTWLPEKQVRAMIDALTLAAAGKEKEANPLGLANELELDVVFMDTTCVKANIHFPVDWVLLRDAARTLIKAITLIRKHGLKHRMPEPASFLKAMNRLSIEMTHSRRKVDGRKARKQVLRQMKSLSTLIARHARRYQEILTEHWEKTDWSQAQAQQVIERIAGVLEKLPAAIKQVHERIIGERQVSNDEKILSLYEDDLHVIVRGKAGAEVEFGNSLLLAEQSDGLIVDFEFLREQSTGDSKLLPKSLNRQQALTGKLPTAISADRGFDCKANRTLLEDKDIFNGICPRDPATLKERAKDEVFMGLQQRRAQTEGRIGIFKNKLLNSLLRAKGYENRSLAIHWAVLTHNLWLLARMDKANAKAPPLAAAA